MSCITEFRVIHIRSLLLVSFVVSFLLLPIPLESQVGSSTGGVQPFTDVRSFGCIGDGATDNTSCLGTAMATANSLYFPDGEYVFSSPVVIHRSDTHWRGESTKTKLRYTGTTATGGAVSIIAEYPDVGVQNVYLENFSIYGNANSKYTLHLYSVARSTFRNLRLRDSVDAALYTQFLVDNLFERISSTVNDERFATQPIHGFWFDRAGVSQESTASRVSDFTIAGFARGDGIKCSYCMDMTFINGASQANKNGIELLNYSSQNQLIGLDFEQQRAGGTDILIDGARATSVVGGQFNGGADYNAVTIKSGRANTFVGGVYGTIEIQRNAVSTTFIGMIYKYGLPGVGRWVDNGVGTQVINATDFNSGETLTRIVNTEGPPPPSWRIDRPFRRR